MVHSSVNEREELSSREITWRALDIENFITNASVFACTFLTKQNSWFIVTIYSREGEREREGSARTSRSDSSIGRRAFALTRREDDWIPRCTRTAKRTTPLTFRYLHTSYVRSVNAIMLFSVSRSPATEGFAAARYTLDRPRRLKSKIHLCLRYTSRSRTVTNAGESVVLLPRVSRLACSMHRCI